MQFCVLNIYYLSNIYLIEILYDVSLNNDFVY